MKKDDTVAWPLLFDFLIRVLRERCDWKWIVPVDPIGKVLEAALMGNDVSAFEDILIRMTIEDVPLHELKVTGSMPVALAHLIAKHRFVSKGEHRRLDREDARVLTHIVFFNYYGKV